MEAANSESVLGPLGGVDDPGEGADKIFLVKARGRWIKGQTIVRTVRYFSSTRRRWAVALKWEPLNVITYQLHFPAEFYWATPFSVHPWLN